MTAKLLGNRYELMEVIGIGGMAVVYKAKDKLLNRLVAVKILKNEFNDNEQFINKFKRESQAAASLSHNNIVNVFDVGVQDNNHYIVMEYVNGKTLKAYIKEQGKLPWKEALFLIKQIAFALDHAHKNNIIHRDIKPHNILLNEDMIPKVTDFGIARAISSATITLVEETMGSVHYISPEQARGGFVDAKSDLYSLGIVLYEMLTGEVPFDSDNSVSVAIKHIQEEIRFPEGIQDVPEGLIDIVYKLVKKSSMDRYHNARELIIDLITIQNNPTTRFMDEPDLSDETKKTPIIGDAQLEEKKSQDIKETPKKEKFKWGKKQLMAIVLIPIILGIMVFVLVNAFDVEEVKVPDLSNQTMEEAIDVLQGYKLDYRLERENSSSVSIDHVIEQDPVAGTMLKEGQEVVLYISDGVKQVKLPDVTKQYEVEGIQILENTGFVINEIERKYNEDYEKGMIYEQSPAPGTLVKEGAEIKLYVSQGKDSAVLNDLVGKTIDEAKEILLSGGLTLGSIKEEVSNKYEKNIVINQDPKAGVELQKKSVVNLTISKGLVKSKSISINIASYLYGADEDEDENGKGKDKDKEEPQQVRVKVFLIDDKNVSTLQYEKAHLSNETITVELKGIGVQSYQVQINNTIYNAENISF
ncbi:Stk1 family PASTA domain-containing Ser/Thr kinase [Alkalibaculum bacchi]|uniref:Stk1 family PASTA domain-containing Ser/Thr kinase n=1 Tax=Alkalibaculum bacchi TaxID=645887 RepID=UPI0026EB8E78|nr:Stk1 family PASTA domain-containing Ser/Thr kinase [Alkalibaculum bacchi]